MDQFAWIKSLYSGLRNEAGWSELNHDQKKARIKRALSEIREGYPDPEGDDLDWDHIIDRLEQEP